MIGKISKNRQQTLLEHSKSVMYLSIELASRMLDLNEQESKDVVNCVIIASLMHDISKCESNDLSDIINHNVTGWAYLSKYTNLFYKYPSVLKPILYHHIVEEQKYTSSSDIVSTIDKQKHDEYFLLASNLLKEEFNIDVNLNENSTVEIPNFYNSSKLQNVNDDLKEWKEFIIRSCLVTSDRICSEIFENGNQEEINNILNNDKIFLKNIVDNLFNNNNVIGNNYSNLNLDQSRLNNQLSIVDTIDNNRTSIIGAAAGFGKTLIGVLWAVKNKKKVLWVCPRNIIAQNTYDSIIRELQTIGETNVKVNLLLTSEYKQGTKFDDDITVTNIDNFLDITTSNMFTKESYKMCSNNVIFDEYHELVSNAPIFAGFIKAMRVRHNLLDCKTVLLSATPVNIEHLWEYSEETFRQTYESQYKDNKIKIEYPNITDIDDINIVNDDVCVLVNSVKTAQQICLNNQCLENAYHTRYTENDLIKLKSELIINHDKFSDINNRFSVVATRIIGTGLDLSWNHFIENVSSPELTVQGIGRINRFNEYNNIPTINLLHLDDKGEEITIRNMYNKELNEKWYDYIKTNLDGKIITISELYFHYENFNKLNQKELKEFYKNTFENSINGLVNIKPRHTNTKKDKNKLGSSNNYRGFSNSFYVTCIGDENNLIESITVDEFILNDEKSNDDAERIKQMKNYNLSNKYALSAKQSNLESFKKKSKNKKFPLLLMTKSYNKNLGLYNK